jgi:7-carboxy-7-deazaguanine synthase
MLKEGKIQVMELFGPTIQGEGIMSGTITHFLRTGGCSLRCSWCDSLFAVLPELVLKYRTLMTTDDIIHAISALPHAPYITFTGGDPAIQDRLGDIIPAMNSMGIRVAVETQGMFFPEWFNNCDVLTFSPKGPSSGNPVDTDDLIEYLIGLGRLRTKLVCIKVVVFNEEDFEYAMHLYEALPAFYYDAFYFTAGTPLSDKSIEELDDTEVIAKSQERILDVVHNQTQVAEMLLKAARISKFNDKVRVGCQQHVLLWPNKDKGV